MKCPKCRNNMVRKSADKSNYYFECPKCHKTIGKTTEVAKIEEAKVEEIAKEVVETTEEITQESTSETAENEENVQKTQENSEILDESHINGDEYVL